jgi:hypothetical protein
LAEGGGGRHTSYFRLIFAYREGGGKGDLHSGLSDSLKIG